MVINKQYVSNNNSYANVTPKWIVIHNTDNPSAGALNHGKAQYNGNFSGYSCHVYVDDKEAYQATPYNRGCWHVGVNYGGKLFGTVNNRNSVGIEICNHNGCEYEKAFANGVDVCKQLMKELNIDADHVVSHFDVCNKNCPSTIRAKGDWNRFKKAISGNTTTNTPTTVTPAGTASELKLYRIRKSWEDSKSQLGAYSELVNAKAKWKSGYFIYDWNGKVVYPETKTETPTKQVCEEVDCNVDMPMLKKGCTGLGVRVLQNILGIEADGVAGNDTDAAIREYQKSHNLTVDGCVGAKTWQSLIYRLKTNTFK